MRIGRFIYGRKKAFGITRHLRDGWGLGRSGGRSGVKARCSAPALWRRLNAPQHHKPHAPHREEPHLRFQECQRPTREGRPFSDVYCGGVLLSREASLAVPSALKGLTSGFGMGPGVSPSLWPPQLYGDVTGSRPYPGNRTVDASKKFCGVCQALGLLVPVSCTPCGASTSGLSTQSSGWGPYHHGGVGGLILRRASRLDAFSGYLFRT